MSFQFFEHCEALRLIKYIEDKIKNMNMINLIINAKIRKILVQEADTREKD